VDADTIYAVPNEIDTPPMPRRRSGRAARLRHDRQSIALLAMRVRLVQATGRADQAERVAALNSTARPRWGKQALHPNKELAALLGWVGIDTDWAALAHP
jgi:hypothetical protein